MNLINHSNLIKVWNQTYVLKKISHNLLKVLRTQTSCQRYQFSGILNEEDESLNYNRRGGYVGQSNRKTNYQRYPREQNYNKFKVNRNYRFGKPNEYSNDSYMFQRFTDDGRNIFGNLSKPNFDNLVPVEKNFYVEHPDVAERPMEEVNSYRKLLNISVKGKNVPKPITKFSELQLPEAIKKVMEEQSYSEPTPIQCQGWPLVLSGRDVIGISQTGSGKTLVFMVPSLIHASNNSQADIHSNERECRPQILVLAPTRELVQQINNVSYQYITHSGLKSACIYGGASKQLQIRCLQGAEICIATPGRLIDFLSEGSVQLNHCTYLVLDEADRMLDMGFEPQIRKIVEQTRPDRQTVMWSATWPKEVQTLAHDFLSDFVQVTVGSEELVANPNIEQNIYFVEERSKTDKMLSLLENLGSEDDTKILIFAQTKRMVDDLSYHLRQLSIPVFCIHGNVSQYRRDHVLQNFRERKSCILVATDVAARGLDITDIQHVINYDFPTNIEDYIHRIGRTARGDKTGSAHSLFTPENAGIARKLISVLKQANQYVNPELYSMANQNKRNPSYSSHSFERRRYFA